MLTESNSLKDQFRNVVEEARMLLPGVQALLGFQTIAVFNQRFTELAPLERNSHMVALTLVVVSVSLLMTPAAYHRIVEPHHVSEKTLAVTTLLICLSLLPLASALSLDFFVVLSLATHERALSLGVGASAFFLLIALWFAFPLRERRKRFGHDAGTNNPTGRQT
ncbi:MULTISPECIES: DUF6328 family protein [unclassified Duganella]|uniref:DUF6328 family protein n=1 Tax=unclassified Duganella TaxID=2636909 RepID=UPI000874F812|nr:MULTISPECIES: DUF6328 family protein [unclassified Duganella]